MRPVGNGVLLATSTGSPPILRVAAVVVGAVLVASVLVSALETVVLPRNAFTRISRVTFAVTDRLLVHQWRNPERSARVRGLFAPVALVSLPMVWMLSVIVGFTFVFWGIGSGTWSHSFDISGSSVTTLGFAAPEGSTRTWVTFVEAIIGLGLVALLISYLPTIYGAYNARERGIRTIRPVAGTPPTAVDFLINLSRFGQLSSGELWRTASSWLLELDQTHCAFPALCFFPEAASGQSWVASVGALLDASALMLSGAAIEFTPDLPVENQGPILVLAHGIPSAVGVARASGLPVEPARSVLELVSDRSTPPPDISIRREEYMAAIDRLTGVVSIAEEAREAAWSRFATIRSSYDNALRGLAGLTLATSAAWSTDRPARVGRPRLVGSQPVDVDWSLPDPTVG